MSYIVLARKLRPSRFENLIGQETVSRTLRNAILANRVAHAFLFTGSRGVGKTSAARILTRALNCLNPEEGNPCGECENCTEISSGASPDVYEIDAASNRGIENIRELRDNVQYAPARCNFKVYIIDEAHMLTLESFNALLKTLEEPPEHVKFILATTDPHKIPQTIISRCQRYDFVRIPIRKMTDFLEEITAAEQLSIPRRALEMISRQAVGGMRDALTMVDQLFSFTGESATEEEVVQILGLVDPESRFDFLESLIQKQPEKAMGHFQVLQEQGHDLHDLLAELIREVKNLSLIQSVGTNSTLFQDQSPDEIKAYSLLVKEISQGELQQMFDILLELEERMKRSTHAGVCFEMGLLQILSMEPLVGIPEMLNEIGRLRDPRKPSREEAGSGNQEADEFLEDPPESGESEAPQLYSGNGVPAVKDIRENTGTRITSMLRSGGREDEEKTTDGIQTNNRAAETGPAEKLTAASNPSLSDKQIEDSSESDAPHVDSNDPPAKWLRFTERAKSHSPVLGSLIRNAVPAEWEEGKMRIGFKSGKPSTLISVESQKTLEALAGEEAGHDVRIEWVSESLDSNLRTVIEQEQKIEKERLEAKHQEAWGHPFVQEVLRVFRGSTIQEVSMNKT